MAADLSARIEDALPADAKVLAPALTRSLQTFLVEEIDKFLGTPLAHRLWVDSNRFAHQQLITALQDDNRYVTVGRNDVKLDLLPLVAVALQRLEASIPQLLGKDVTLPRIDPATAPDDIRTLLQDALGRKLPADFGSITLLRGSQGYEAKQALKLVQRPRDPARDRDHRADRGRAAGLRAPLAHGALARPRLAARVRHRARHRGPARAGRRRTA